MRVLVTGATGFVARTVIPLLVARGHSVRAVVRRPDVAVPQAAETVTIDDIGPATAWGNALQGMDGVVHLAARVHVMRDRESDPLAAFRRVNTAGTRVLAEAAAAAGVKRMVYLSSVKALADESRPDELSEETEPDPHSPYGISKLEAERALAEISTRTGLEVAVIRPPLVYGPGVGGNFLRLMQAVDRGIPLPLGALENRRSLIFVGNLADAIQECLTHPQAAGARFLVHDGRPMSTAELVRAIAEALNKPARLLPVPPSLLALAARLARREAMLDRIAGSLVIDDGAIRRALNWRPPCYPAYGLRLTAEWFKAVRG
ncbi:NAD-dependent dehydratase [Azospirillum argentinense]|uniref:NAD-dependent dehydratase n=1 Tax=Azospirillum argentinense TaxID=2970906 RepID=A0A060DF63_9PROT|nr:NAD-dependent epimerase/dehydratase family protein [Azospirillum argentinense]AIB11345.1 NAD-dependent dehydratase [Azospirillum argentinense]EZQ08277.1 NAD-dependent dehydratase [Azospirillum argentinense]PNR00558.1 NAD-dependent dehydratase [Azospirillum argentinense]